MFTRLALIAAATLMSGTAHAADPAKPATQPQSQSQPPSGPAQVVLASAEVDHASVSSDQQTVPAPKRRIARVTTCRCGDPQAQPEQ